MESLPLIYRASHPPTTSFKAFNNGSLCFDFLVPKSTLRSKKFRYGGGIVRASMEPNRRGEMIDGVGRSDGGGRGYTGSAMEVTTFNQSFGDAHAAASADFPVWDKIGAVVRLSYGIGIYGAMALAGRFICSLSGIDSFGGFQLSFDAIIQGLGYATPPIMALLFILDDEVVKVSPHARAIRDVEDEELRSFFYGMSPWQFILIVAASSVGEELFYRAAVQGRVFVVAAAVALRSSAGYICCIWRKMSDNLMDKVTSLGERLRIGGSEVSKKMSASVSSMSDKMKELFQGPNQADKIVEEATAKS